MDYRVYKTAADRHLETCLRLKELALNKYSNRALSSGEQKKQSEILGNIHYLSGYALECILHYAIVEYVVKVDSDFRKKVVKKKGGNFEKVSVRELEVSHNNLNVGYDYGRYRLYRPNHKFQSNIDFFNYENKLSGIDSIRGINGKTIPQKNVKDLFFKWSAEIRYSNSDIEHLIKPTDVYGFLEFAEEVHTGITNLILPQYA